MRSSISGVLVFAGFAAALPQGGVPSVTSGVSSVASAASSGVSAVASTLSSPNTSSTASSPTSSATSAGNGTSGAVSRNGTSLLNGTFESIPQYFNTTTDLSGSGVNFTGNPTVNGTNTTFDGPYMPSGGNMIRTPSYRVQSNFDFQSINLGLNQEWIELDAFHNGLARFSVEEFEAAGLTADDRYLIEFMADQEIGHAIALSNMLGPERAAKQCIYQYPYNTVQEFILFCQLITRFGESGTYGFLPHLDSRPAAQVLLQSISIEARQQMAFRQFQGLFAMPYWHIAGVPQSYQWTLLHRYIKSCPSNNPVIAWQIFPDLEITNQPDLLGGRPAISQNKTGSQPGDEILVRWDQPGRVVGPDNMYKTAIAPGLGQPKFAAFINQLNVTYVPLQNVTNSTASFPHPNATVWGANDLLVAGTVFVALTDSDPYLTPYNLSIINNHTIAGPALFQAS